MSVCQYSQIHQKCIWHMYFTVAYLQNVSSPIGFPCIVCQNFPLPKLSHVQCMELLYKGAYFIFHCVLNLNVNFVCLVGGKKTVFKD